MVDTLKQHVPYEGYEGLNELAERFEDKTYAAATSQSDYLRKISLKMLILETRSQNPMPDAYMQSPTTTNNVQQQRQQQIQSSGGEGYGGGGSGANEDSSMEPGDWRAQLSADSRHRIVGKILDTLKRHLPYKGDEGLNELKSIAESFEEKVYTVSTSQSDYLRMISLKMLAMVNRPQHPMPDAYMQPHTTANSVNP